MKYRFGKKEMGSSFTEDMCNIIYFPVFDSPGIPTVILNKTGEIIEFMIRNYESENGCILDLSRLCLCARLEAFLNKEGKFVKVISVVISGFDGHEDIWMESEYDISKSALLEQFREYFMNKLSDNLFNT